MRELVDLEKTSLKKEEELSMTRRLEPMFLLPRTEIDLNLY